MVSGPENKYAGTNVKTPILLITWNRPAETRAVLESLAEVRPARLFVSGDGPRDERDASLIHAVKAEVERSVSWPCEVRTLYSEEHLGCKRGVVGAIDWFFENVSEGIILEDDVVPNVEFFSFCENLLDRYRDNPRVMHISGDNSAKVSLPEDWSYCFIRYPHIWGWATWKDRWELYDRNLARFSKFEKAGFSEEIFFSDLERKIWYPIFRRLLLSDEIDTWDWQWAATVFMNEGLAVQPTTNLVTNIGFGPTATHTKKLSQRSAVPNLSIGELKHPEVVWSHPKAQRQVIRNSQKNLRSNSSVKWLRVVAGRGLSEVKNLFARDRDTSLSSDARGQGNLPR